MLLLFLLLFLLLLLLLVLQLSSRSTQSGVHWGEGSLSDSATKRYQQTLLWSCETNDSQRAPGLSSSFVFHRLGFLVFFLFFVFDLIWLIDYFACGAVSLQVMVFVHSRKDTYKTAQNLYEFARDVRHHPRFLLLLNSIWRWAKTTPNSTTEPLNRRWCECLCLTPCPGSQPVTICARQTERRGPCKPLPNQETVRWLLVPMVFSRCHHRRRRQDHRHQVVVIISDTNSNIMIAVHFVLGAFCFFRFSMIASRAVWVRVWDSSRWHASLWPHSCGAPLCWRRYSRSMLHWYASDDDEWKMMRFVLLLRLGFRNSKNMRFVFVRLLPVLILFFSFLNSNTGVGSQSASSHRCYQRHSSIRFQCGKFRGIGNARRHAGIHRTPFIAFAPFSSPFVWCLHSTNFVDFWTSGATTVW